MENDEALAVPSNLTDRWNRFWHAPGNLLSLGVFRFLFAICLLAEIETTRDRSLFAIEGGFHYPYIGLIKPVPEFVYQAMHNLEYPLAALLALGIVTRFSAAALLCLQGYIFFADRLDFRNHPFFFLLILGLLAISPAGKSFSIPALLRRLRPRSRDAVPSGPVIAPLTIQRLIQFQVAIVYLYAAFHKLNEQYLGGHVLATLMAPSVLDGWIGGILGALLSPGTLAGVRVLVQTPGFWILPSVITVLLELTMPVALWIPRVRVGAMIFGICFHTSIAFLMGIYTFSAAMIASYVLFLDPDTIPRMGARVKARFGGTAAPAPARAARAEKKGRQKKGSSGSRAR